jgi:hypothetical protein
MFDWMPRFFQDFSFMVRLSENHLPSGDQTWQLNILYKWRFIYCKFIELNRWLSARAHSFFAVVSSNWPCSLWPPTAQKCRKPKIRRASVTVSALQAMFEDTKGVSPKRLLHCGPQAPAIQIKRLSTALSEQFLTHFLRHRHIHVLGQDSISRVCCLCRHEGKFADAERERVFEQKCQMWMVHCLKI